MPIQILMPALSPTMTEGNIAKWTKKEGDKISAGEVIAEIETDKATMEVEAVDEGILKKIVISAGTENVPINALIAVLVEEDESDADIDGFIAKISGAVVKNNPDHKKQESDQSLREQTDSISSEIKIFSHVSSNFHEGGKIFASPLAKRIASIENIEIGSIKGTGPRGRIIKRDVLDAIANNTHSKITRNVKEYFAVPNNNMRKVIAKRLLESKITVPHFYLNIECRMDAILEAREQINLKFGEDKSKKLSVNDFVIMASAKALRDVPDANSSWTNEAILKYNNVDISVAVAIDGGLVTPIIQNADQKGITKISSKMKDLARRAKDGKLSPEEYQGGSFTISNLGMYGIKSFNAIINPPQSCILAIGKSSKKPVVNEAKNQIEIATIMEVNLSCDHRVVDGVVGANFLEAFKKYIETPILMFI